MRNSIMVSHFEHDGLKVVIEKQIVFGGALYGYSIIGGYEDTLEGSTFDYESIGQACDAAVNTIDGWDEDYVVDNYAREI